MQAPQNKREFVAALRRAEAKIYHQCATYLRRKNPPRTIEGAANDFELYARCREDDATFAEKVQGADVQEILNRMIKEST